MEVNDKLQSFLSTTALVIDDEIIDESSTISGIINKLEQHGTLFVKKRELVRSIESISNLSFIILDWDLTKEEEKLDLPVGVSLGSTLIDDNKNDIRNFIINVISNYFIPIFIFTRENIDSIKAYLETRHVIKDAISKNRIFFSNKDSLKDEYVISTLNDWINDSMTVYTYRIMDESIEKAKHRFFNDMYTCDSNWPCHVYQTLKADDSVDINSDFQEFLMTAYTSTIEPIKFENKGFDKIISLDDQEILKIYSKIKFLEYKEDWKVGPHPGDIYVIDNDQKNVFYINISASCDMRSGKYYFIKGRELEHTEEKICHYIVRKVMNRQAVCFDFRNVKILKVNKPDVISIGEKKDKTTYKRVGRLLSPYINALQEKFSNYITRTGVLREPEI